MDLNRAVYLALIAGLLVSSILLVASLALGAILPDDKLVYTLELAGACTLMLTPYARIIVSMIIFAMNGDKRYFMLSMFVLLMMLIAILLGAIFHTLPGI